MTNSVKACTGLLPTVHTQHLRSAGRVHLHPCANIVATDHVMVHLSCPHNPLPSASCQSELLSSISRSNINRCSIALVIYSAAVSVLLGGTGWARWLKVALAPFRLPAAGRLLCPPVMRWSYNCTSSTVAVGQCFADMSRGGIKLRSSGLFDTGSSRRSWKPLGGFPYWKRWSLEALPWEGGHNLTLEISWKAKIFGQRNVLSWQSERIWPAMIGVGFIYTQKKLRVSHIWFRVVCWKVIVFTQLVTFVFCWQERWFLSLSSCFGL